MRTMDAGKPRIGTVKLWKIVVVGFNAFLGFALSTSLFAMLFRYVPPD